MTTPTTPAAIGYVRVSREEQARDDRTSLATQREQIAVLAAQRRLELSEIFADPGVSGGTAEDRPGFMALVRFCEANRRPARHPGTVVVLNDSRWGRFDDPEESTYWRMHLKKHFGWVVRFVEGDDTEDATARPILRSLYSAQASAYREQIRRNARRGARGTAAQGYWQTEAPLGYRRLAIEPGRPGRVLDVGQRKGESERTRLTLGPEDEVAVVRFIYDSYAGGGLSLGKLSRVLLDRWPSRRWSRTTVQAVLKNPAYVGDVVWCRKENESHGHQHYRDPADWEIARDAHPAIVSRDLFAAVQRRLDENRVQLRHGKVFYLLSGLVHCAHCGQPYLGAGGPAGPPGDIDRYRFYKDRGSDKRYADCPGLIGTLQRRIVEPLVLQTIGRVVAHPSVRTILAEEFERALTMVDEFATTRQGSLDQEASRLGAERERLVDAIQRGTLAADEATARLSAIRTRLGQITHERERARFDDRRTEQVAGERDRLLAIATDFPALAKKLTGPALRNLVAPWLQDGTVDKVDRTLTLTIRRVPALSIFSVMATSPEPG